MGAGGSALATAGDVGMGPVWSGTMLMTAGGALGCMSIAAACFGGVCVASCCCATAGGALGCMGVAAACFGAVCGASCCCATAGGALGCMGVAAACFGAVCGASCCCARWLAAAGGGICFWQDCLGTGICRLKAAKAVCGTSCVGTAPLVGCALEAGCLGNGAGPPVCGGGTGCMCTAAGSALATWFGNSGCLGIADCDMAAAVVFACTGFEGTAAGSALAVWFVNSGCFGIVLEMAAEVVFACTGCMGTAGGSALATWFVNSGCLGIAWDTAAAVVAGTGFVGTAAGSAWATWFVNSGCLGTASASSVGSALAAAGTAWLKPVGPACKARWSGDSCREVAGMGGSSSSAGGNVWRR